MVLDVDSTFKNKRSGGDFGSKGGKTGKHKKMTYKIPTKKI